MKIPAVGTGEKQVLCCCFLPSERHSLAGKFPQKLQPEIQKNIQILNLGRVSHPKLNRWEAHKPGEILTRN